MYWLEIHISEGLRFPLPAQVHKFFHHTRLHPIHTHMNIICVLLEVCVLNRQYGICLGLEEVLYVYTIKRKNLGKYYFVVDAKLVQLMTNLPNTKNKKKQAIRQCSVV